MNVLSLRGGGIRGVATAHLLDNLEQRVGKPVHQFTDLIVGTSAGAIIAAGLAIGMKAEDIRRLFEVEGDLIFKRRLFFRMREILFFPKYEAKNLVAALNAHFLPETKLGDVLTKLMICSTRYEGQTAEFWKSWLHPGMSMVEAVSSSAAAPTYFEPIKIGDYHYCDGGIWANDPAVWGCIQARKLWPLRGALNVVDIACPDQADFTAPRGGGLASLAPRIVNLCINSGENASMSGAATLSDRYVGITPPLLTASRQIGDSSVSNIENLKKCVEYGMSNHVRDITKCFQLG